ncbi:MAG: hypothetical protein KatS3mg091_138 [Patescibacteria group bacterium]|nr:MAG: hypothetical protein KatS3mg091_138 [Patescibacteria group bacterium]
MTAGKQDLSNIEVFPYIEYTGGKKSGLKNGLLQQTRINRVTKKS